MKKKVMLLLSLVLVMSTLFSGCALFNSMVHDLKGSLIGVPYNITFYDNYGEKSFITTGEKIDIEGNYVEELGVDSDGSTITNYTLSSVITITIDGNEIESCGDTVIFAETGLTPDVEFSLSDIFISILVLLPDISVDTSGTNCLIFFITSKTLLIRFSLTVNVTEILSFK